MHGAIPSALRVNVTTYAQFWGLHLDGENLSKVWIGLCAAVNFIAVFLVWHGEGFSLARCTGCPVLKAMT
jgi:hypothetical protein